MKKLLTIICLALLGVLLLPGCTATKIEYEQNNKGETKYSLWHNDHWMKTSTERLAGGMDKNGKFSVELAGRDSSPSEEFNKTMQTYMGAIVSAMQIAAAAYNPSASGAIQNAAAKSAATTTATSNASESTAPAATSSAQPSQLSQSSQSSPSTSTDCKDGSCDRPAATNVTATAESPATK